MFDLPHATVKRIEKCRVCGNASLIPCVDMGSQYLSSIFPENLNYRERLPKYPLELVMCDTSYGKTSCGLVQLAHAFNLQAMYDAYPYTSSTNPSMRSILQDVAGGGRAFVDLRPGDLILDIGCNDGTLLSFFEGQGFDLLGIDAAQNIVPVLSSPDFKLVRDFFSARAFRAATSKKARLAFSIAMFYHLTDPVAFSGDAADCLADDGVWVIQMAYLPSMLINNMYDNIVHEHCGYYSTQHMSWIMEQAGLQVFHVELNDVYGGSFRLFIKKADCDKHSTTRQLEENLEWEKQLRLDDLATYHEFMRRIERTRQELLETCRNNKSSGKSTWVYGASTKGNTILQFCNLSCDSIVAAADANPFKFGRYMIGSDIPVKDEESMRQAAPDVLLALPYSFVTDFISREAKLVAKGTKFIVPLPKVTVLP